ncbi:hypothetical protein YPPY89_3006, partial [Yersinia pestis PY-89]
MQAGVKTTQLPRIAVIEFRGVFHSGFHLYVHECCAR